MLDPTTCLQPLFQTNTTMSPPSKPFTAMLHCSLLSPCLVCIGCYIITLLLLGLGYHTIILLNDVIIMMLTISDEGWKVRLFPPRRFVSFESPRIRVPGIGSKTECA